MLPAAPATCRQVLRFARASSTTGCGTRAIIRGIGRITITAEFESLVKNVRVVAAGERRRAGSSLPFHTAPISRIPDSLDGGQHVDRAEKRPPAIARLFHELPTC